MKRFKDFLIENKQDKWIFEGDFIVTKDMVINGKMVKEKMPDEVTGYFDCRNLNLTTLEGCPSKIDGGFFCSGNKLTSLEEGPTSVNNSFYCSNNNLTSLEGSPKIVNGSFYCHNNLLPSLEGSPTIVNGDFYCDNNLLSSLEGSPTTVDGYFSCSYNKLTSLEGSPTKISGDFYCHNNLKDLTIERDFIKSGRCSSQSNYGKANAKAYWQELLKYMIDEKIEIDKIATWPKNFLTPEIISSSKGIIKFNI